MTAIVVHTNGPISESFYIVDNDGGAVPIPSGSYKSQWRKRGYYDTVALEFITGGGTGKGTITRGATMIDSVTYDVLLIEADQALVDALEPGVYEADILRTDVAEWIMDYTVDLVQGVTAP